MLNDLTDICEIFKLKIFLEITLKSFCAGFFKLTKRSSEDKIIKKSTKFYFLGLRLQQIV